MDNKISEKCFCTVFQGFVFPPSVTRIFDGLLLETMETVYFKAKDEILPPPHTHHTYTKKEVVAAEGW